MGWRRVSEAVLQKTPVSFTNKQFKATSNARNEAMFREATEFAMSIQTLEKDMKALLKKIDVHFKNLRGILVSPLPRIYDEGPNGVQPLDGEARLLGANMDFELIPKAAEEARRRIQVEVLDPLHEWMGIYRQIMERMKVLEALRLELDSRRRTVANLQGKLTRLQATPHSGGDKRNYEIEDTARTMHHKQEKMDFTGQQFLEMERTVYNSLYTLVRDTAVLRDYTHCCLDIIKEAFQSAAKAYDTAPQTQQSTTNAAPYNPQPESKYESQLPTNERATPKGIGGLFDRLRTRAFAKMPLSPSMRDANDPDQQRRYSNAYGPYAGMAERYPSGYGAHANSMRPTHESEAVPPSAGGYAQQPGGYGANPYMPNSGRVPTYAPQHTGGNGANNYPQVPQYSNGGKTFGPPPSYAPQHTGGNGGNSNGYGELASMPSRDVTRDMSGPPGAARYGSQTQQPQMVAAGGQGWTQDGY